MKAHSSHILSLLLILLCGCSNEIAEEADKIIEKPVPILINSPRQIDIETKAVVDAFTDMNISNVSIFGIEGSNNCYLEDLSPIASDDYSGLRFDTPITYPVNGNNVTLYGIYPSNILTPLSDNYMEVNISGNDDLMYAQQYAGNKSNPTPVTFTFNHKLAQIRFKLNNCLTSDTTVTDNVSIIAVGPSTATMSLTSGELTDPSGSSSFELSTDTRFDELSKDTSAPTDITGELLLFPNSDYSFSLKVGENYYAVTFAGATTTSWQQSTIYTLTISINSLDNPLTEAPI